MRRFINGLLFAAVVAMGAIQGYQVFNTGGQVLLYYQEEGPTQEALNNMEEQERSRGKSRLPDSAAWAFERDLEIENRALGRTAKTDGFFVYGSRELAVYCGLERGTYGGRWERGSCMISRGLAMELFGSTEVTGKTVWYGRQDYTVRGVTEDARKQIFLPAKRDQRFRYVMFDYRTADPPGSVRGRAEAGRLMNQYGMGGASCSADGTYFAAAAGILSVLPVWLLMAKGIFLYFRTEKRPLFQGLAVGLAAAVFGGSLYLLGRLGAVYPRDLIPTRWSDFDFWVKAYQDIAADVRNMREITQCAWLAGIRQNLGFCALCSAGAGMWGLLGVR